MACLHTALQRGALMVGATAMGLGAGCEDFETPAELMKPTVIAVVATPPITKPGESSALQVVMVDPSGPMTPSETTWEIVPTYAGYGTLGRIEPEGAGTAIYHAPETIPPLPEDALPVDTLHIHVQGGGATINVVKLVGIANLEASNPSIELLADGAPVVEELVVARDSLTQLELVEAPEPGEDARYAWYSTFGTIDKYQSNPAELQIAADETVTEGWIHGVYRDGTGGVAWRSIRLTIASP